MQCRRKSSDGSKRDCQHILVDVIWGKWFSLMETLNFWPKTMNWLCKPAYWNLGINMKIQDHAVQNCRRSSCSWFRVADRRPQLGLLDPWGKQNRHFGPKKASFDAGGALEVAPLQLPHVKSSRQSSLRVILLAGGPILPTSISRNGMSQQFGLDWF